MGLLELLVLSVYLVKLEKEVQPERREKQDLQVHLENPDILVMPVKKVLRAHLDHKENKALLALQDCQDFPAREVLQDYQ